MAQQVGSTSGTAPAARETEARETEAALGGESVVTEAGWPGGTGEASLTVDGQIVGAIGVSGGTVEQDMQCAEAALQLVE